MSSSRWPIFALTVVFHAGCYQSQKSDEAEGETSSRASDSTSPEDQLGTMTSTGWLTAGASSTGQQTTGVNSTTAGGATDSVTSDGSELGDSSPGSDAGSADETGSTQSLALHWQRPFDSGRDDYPVDLLLDDQGGVIVVGYTQVMEGSTTWNTYPFLQRYNAEGHRIWHFSHQDPSGTDMFYAASDARGGVFLVFGRNQSTDLEILHIDHTGKLVQTRVHTVDTSIATVIACRLDHDDRLRVVWKDAEAGGIHFSWFTPELDARETSRVDLSRPASAGGMERAVFNAEGDLWISGSFDHPADLAVTRISTDAKLLWERTYDHGFADHPLDYSVDNDDRITLIVKDSDPFGPGHISEYVIQYGPDGQLNWLKDEPDASQDPQRDEYAHWSHLITNDREGGVIAYAEIRKKHGIDSHPKVAGRSIRRFTGKWQNEWSYEDGWDPLQPYDRSWRMLAGPRDMIYLLNRRRGSEYNIELEAFGPAED